MSSHDLEAAHEKDDSSSIPTATPPNGLSQFQNLYPDNIVVFDGKDDPEAPLNWPTKKKIITTMLYGLTTAGSTWASSVYSSATAAVEAEFNVSTEVSTLGLSLFLVGFGIGPLLWAPLSEVYGRRLAVFVPYFVAACFCFGTATAKDIQTLLITRFFLGFFCSAPVTNTGGTFHTHLVYSCV